MYGEEKLNASNLLRYSLTKEFIEAFSSLKYMGLELPPLLLRNYHQHIAPLVNQNLTNGQLIKKLQQKHGLYYICDVQKALERKPSVEQDLLKDSGRNMLAVQARFLRFAMDRFPDEEVLVILRNPQEEELFLSGLDMPPSYRVFNYRERLKETRPVHQEVTSILTEADLLIQKYTKHLVFDRPEFRLWLRKFLLYSIKVVHLMNRVILDEPIRIILSDVEVVNPDITMSLLAARYNLFFINAPVVLITDRNLIPTRAAYHCAWGDHYRTWLKKRGIDASKIIRTGNLRFEYDPHPSSLDKKNMASQFNIPEGNYIAAYTTQTFPEEVNRSVVQWIQYAAAGQPFTVLIKRHPSDKTDYSAFTGTGQIIEVPDSIGLFDLLPNIDYLMTISSNTAIEAALMRKGIIVLQPEIPYQYDRHDNDYHSLLAKSKAGLVASSPEQLKNIIAKLCSSERLHRVLHNMAERFLSKTIHKGALSAPSEDMDHFIKTLL
ncbi:MAG: CDP-glycerol glycerophosphotransferase family protein [Bacillota bacterium]|nr:CDP-glycerol glycerophosphotransferase family protein [Bacillota bacterium]